MKRFQIIRANSLDVLESKINQAIQDSPTESIDAVGVIGYDDKVHGTFYQVIVFNENKEQTKE